MSFNSVLWGSFDLWRWDSKTPTCIQVTEGLYFSKFVELPDVRIMINLEPLQEQNVCSDGQKPRCNRQQVC